MAIMIKVGSMGNLSVKFSAGAIEGST
jgi:hypothetical protein